MTTSNDLASELAAAEAALASAEAEQATLDAAAADTKAEAAEARAAFEAAPSAKTHTAAAVATQIATNAARDATHHRDAVVELRRHERDGVRADIERSELSPDLDWSRVQVPLDRVRDAAVAFAREIDASMTEVATVLEQWRVVRQRASTLGLQVHVAPFESLLTQLRAEIHAALGETDRVHDEQIVAIVGTGFEVPTVRAVIARPVKIPRHLL